jgi:hypothetical protein
MTRKLDRQVLYYYALSTLISSQIVQISNGLGYAHNGLAHQRTSGRDSVVLSELERCESWSQPPCCYRRARCRLNTVSSSSESASVSVAMLQDKTVKELRELAKCFPEYVSEQKKPEPPFLLLLQSISDLTLFKTPCTEFKNKTQARFNPFFSKSTIRGRNNEPSAINNKNRRRSQACA